MATYGQSTKVFDVERLTWQFQAPGGVGVTPAIEIYRQQAETAEDGTVTTQNSQTPIRLEQPALVGLAPFIELPSQLTALLPTEEAIAQFLSHFLLLIAVVGDAADAKDLAEKEDPRVAIEQPNYFGFYNGLLSESINLFLYVRYVSDLDLPVSNCYTDLMGAIQFQQLPGFQASMSNLFAAMSACGHEFSESQTSQMRSLLDANGFQSVVFPLG